MIIYVVMIGEYDDHRLVGVCQRQDRAEEIGGQPWEESKGREEVDITAHEEGQVNEYDPEIIVACFPTGPVFRVERPCANRAG